MNIKKYIRYLFIGMLVYILGLFIVGISSNFFASNNIEHSYYYGIIFSNLLLSSILVIVSIIIIKEIKKISNR